MAWAMWPIKAAAWPAFEADMTATASANVDYHTVSAHLVAA